MGLWFWLTVLGLSAVLAFGAYYLCVVLGQMNSNRNEQKNRWAPSRSTDTAGYFAWKRCPQARAQACSKTTFPSSSTCSTKCRPARILLIAIRFSVVGIAMATIPE
jgi:hypothetical protein